MKQAKDLLTQHRLTFLLWLSLAVGLLAQWLFIGRPLGISWFIIVVTILAVLFFSGRRAGIATARQNLWLWPALLFFAAMVFIRANPFLTFLNITTTLALLAFVFYFYAAGSVAHLPLSGILTLPLRMAGESLGNTVPVINTAVQPLSANQGRQREFVPVLRGGALALPIVAVFAALLASADLVFSAYLQRIIGLDFATLSPYIGRGLFIGLVTISVAGGTATAVLRGLRDAQDDESWIEALARKMPLHISLSSVETATIMLLVSGLFLAFIMLQAAYLFGGEANISREGFTYAEYARRGFSELVLVASMSLALILILNWLTRRESKRQIKWFNAFSSLLIGLVLLLLVTAFWRMRLYEQAYGYTELRLIVLVFELWLGILLLWFMFTLWRAPENFAIGFLVVAMGFVGTLNLLNPDDLIVRHNLERYRETGDLDMHYLTGLSSDAVPGLVAVWSDVAADEQLIDLPYCYEDDCTQTLGEIVSDNLQARHENMRNNTDWLSGRSYHRSRYQAYQALACYNNAQAAAVKLGSIRFKC